MNTTYGLRASDFRLVGFCSRFLPGAIVTCRSASFDLASVGRFRWARALSQTVQLITSEGGSDLEAFDGALTLTAKQCTC